MSTDQNDTRDRSRDQVRISGGPGAPGETEPSAHDPKHDLATGTPAADGRHAPTDPGTDGTHTGAEGGTQGSTTAAGSAPHTATEAGTHGSHTAAGSHTEAELGTHGSDTAGADRTDSALDPDDRTHDKSHSTVVTDDAATADGLSGKPIVTADPAVPGESTADRHDHHEPHDVEPHSATVSREPAVPATTATTPHTDTDTDKPFFDGDLLDVLNTRWKEVQASFVDNPHDAVTRADLLVAETVEQITTRWSEHQQQLQGRWSRGTDGDTEDLRQALRDYRTFFQKLLTLGN